MTVLSPNEIAAMIYFMGGWGPRTGVTLVPNSDGKQKRPPKDDPIRQECEAWLDTAIAVCLAESGGDTNAKNPNSSASGLWQIMVSVHEAKINQIRGYVHTEYNQGQGKLPTIFDPRVNTLVAARIYQEAGNRWTPWEAYNTGQYIRHRGHGKEAYLYITNRKNLEKQRLAFIANIAESENYADLAGSVAGAVTTPFQILGNLRSMLSGIGASVGVFLLGLILLALGIWALIANTRVGKVAKSASPVSAAKKLVK